MSRVKPVVVSLDRPREIAWTNRARYRIGTLANPPKLTDLTEIDRAYTALCAFLWAMLADKPEDFPSPEHIAEHVNPGELANYVRSLTEAINAAADSPKNGHGSTPSPSPASSSD